MDRVPIRAKAEKILNPIIKSVPISSNMPKNGNDLYSRYTGGLNQKRLEKDWDSINPRTKKKGQMTGCNAFVGWYSSQLGTIYLGGFYIEEDLRKAGMQRAWVRPSSGAKPQYGDICLHAGGLHSSVSLDMSGGEWPRLNAGQGGPGIRRDIIDVSRGPWTGALLKGWVDIESYFAQREAVPDWLVGWWQVSFRGDTYYYFFDLTHQVKWSEYRPKDTIARMLATDGGVGTFSVEGAQVAIRWRSGNTEKFTWSGDKLSGTWNDSAAISAFRMS